MASIRKFISPKTNLSRFCLISKCIQKATFSTTNDGEATTVGGQKDFFGYEGQAELYRQFRPTYPERLLESLNEKCLIKDLALDIACGSGQLTLALAQTQEVAKSDSRNKSRFGLGFSNVIGIDQSEQQLSKAMEFKNIEYHFADALNLNMGSKLVQDNSCDLVTIAQGLHWFMNEDDNDDAANKLYKEICRILKPDIGVFAVLGYSTPNFLAYDKMHECFSNYYLHTLGSHNYHSNTAINENKCYWEIDRKIVDTAFQDKNFSPPFDGNSFERSVFSEPKIMNEVQLFGYLESMSGYQTYCNINGKFNENGERNEQFIDPLDELRIVFRDEMKRKKDDKMIVNFPFFLLTMKK